MRRRFDGTWFPNPHLYNPEVCFILAAESLHHLWWTLEHTKCSNKHQKETKLFQPLATGEQRQYLATGAFAWMWGEPCIFQRKSSHNGELEVRSFFPFRTEAPCRNYQNLCRPQKWQRRWVSYSAFATALGTSHSLLLDLMFCFTIRHSNQAFVFSKDLYPCTLFVTASCVGRATWISSL